MTAKQMLEFVFPPVNVPTCQAPELTVAIPLPAGWPSLNQEQFLRLCKDKWAQPEFNGSRMILIWNSQGEELMRAMGEGTIHRPVTGDYTTEENRRRALQVAINELDRMADDFRSGRKVWWQIQLGQLGIRYCPSDDLSPANP